MPNIARHQRSSAGDRSFKERLVVRIGQALTKRHGMRQEAVRFHLIEKLIDQRGWEPEFGADKNFPVFRQDARVVTERQSTLR